MAYKTHIVREVERSQALDAVLEAASEQGGYVTAAQATRLDLTRDDIVRLERAGDLQRVRRGVFRMRHTHARNEADIAAWLHFEGGRLPWERHGTTIVVLSHASAAGLRNLGTVIARLPIVTLPPDSSKTPRVEGIEVRRAPLRAVDWAWTDVDEAQVPVTTAARTIVDLLADRQEPSYVRRAMAEALATNRATAEEIVDAAKHRRVRTLGLEREVTRLLETLS